MKEELGTNKQAAKKKKKTETIIHWARSIAEKRTERDGSQRDI